MCGLTPLELALQSCRPSHIGETADLAAVLLQAGARKSERTREFVRAIGEAFERVRPIFNPDALPRTSAAAALHPV